MFYTITKKDGDSCYDYSRIRKIILTQKNRPDYKSRFLDFDEVLQYLYGLHLVLTVETNFDNYKGEDRNEVKDWSFEPSVWDTEEHSASSNSTVVANQAALDIQPDDNDLPF